MQETFIKTQSNIVGWNTQINEEKLETGDNNEGENVIKLWRTENQNQNKRHMALIAMATTPRVEDWDLWQMSELSLLKSML